ncbi:zinc-binding alcohol dehydrogenase family protein [Noviherbaspirillum sp. L7-7A]|uniref:zinc-binding alcohol dehydrogenase family protein n=1 Tax=Noviherbaspirillum sp. L7-7A TaxID=2850560 RepID=UPI001C2B7EDA|nr:zinc-binding alcohol dehydrogenase family protein [Noviherbaspirillum sp. L7-7A]MBV0881307.1 zinc-binding alcohol dehydrogenase family protein [Noviherbaspirillum sp. L7-7A]
MKAVVYHTSHKIEHPEALLDATLPDPVAQGSDLLVEVRAVSVNPVDTKVRANVAPEPGQAKILGWDAAGVVRAVGPEVTLFRPGDRVWYAGSIARQGSYAELQLVDERIVGPMPASLGFAEAAALPLTSLTAWEMLFQRLEIPVGGDAGGKSLLVIGAAGGVGSIIVQLARQLTGLTVVGTASRPQSQDWIRQLGAHHAIDHGQPLSRELERLGLPQPEYIVSLSHTDQHFAEIAACIAPQGKFGLIDDPDLIDIRLLKRKSASVHWEFMFTRSLFGTADMAAQHAILSRVAQLVDAGTIRTTLNQHFGSINAANLKQAHALIESHQARGKIVLEGW